MISVQNAIITTTSHARQASRTIKDRYYAIKADVSNKEVRRLCTACATIDFDHSRGHVTDPKKIRAFIWPIDIVILQRDSCNFCRLVFDALSAELNDPLQPEEIQEFIQDHLKGLSFKRWAEEKYRWYQRAIHMSDKTWPFGHSRDPPETREAVRELIQTSKEEMKHLEKSNDVAVMMAAGTAVAAGAHQLGGRRSGGNVALAEAAEAVAWTSVLYQSSKGKRLPCWIVGTVSLKNIKIEVCARGRQPRARLGLLRNFNIFIQGEHEELMDWHYGLQIHQRIDLDLTSVLLAACERDHASTCGEDIFREAPPRSPGGPPFRFINLQHSRLQDFHTHTLPKYAALSYVWGGRQDQMLRCANKAQLYRVGGFIQDALPATISAAIYITRSIGLKYLWIDSWCIVQDDPADKDNQISRMDIIYKSAAVTLVAADKDQTAHSGIKGITADTYREGFDGQTFRELCSAPRIRGLIPISVKQDLSTWESRAWTFQEKVLSRRLLVFSEGYMVWHCRACVAREDMADADAGTGQLALRAPDAYSVLPLTKRGVYRRSRTFAVYARLVRQYTGRVLGHQQDVLKAFTAITSELAGAFDCAFVAGVPETLLDVALLWQPAPLAVGADAPGSAHVLRRRRDFPSWSWAGWEGRVRYDSTYGVHTNHAGALVQAIEEEAVERIRPLVFFYKVGEDRGLAPIGLLDPLFEHLRIPEDWEAGNLPLGQRERIESRLSVSQIGAVAGAIVFESTVADFVIGESATRTMRFQIGHGQITELEEEWQSVKSDRGEKVGRIKIHDRDCCVGHRYEFVVLSEAQFFGSERQVEALGYTLYNVLAIKRVRSHGGVWAVERCGVGKVKKEAWHRANPRKEVFLLQ